MFVQLATDQLNPALIKWLPNKIGNFYLNCKFLLLPPVHRVMLTPALLITLQMDPESCWSILKCNCCCICLCWMLLLWLLLLLLLLLLCCYCCCCCCCCMLLLLLLLPLLLLLLFAVAIGRQQDRRNIFQRRDAVSFVSFMQQPWLAQRQQQRQQQQKEQQQQQQQQ